MCVHYLFADVAAFLLYRVIRYRRKVVRQNLTSSFPAYSANEILQLERQFYQHFCDLIAESIKFFSMSANQMRQHMQFRGLERIEESCRKGRSCAVYLGHYTNWEWVSSLQLWLDPSVGRCVQLYHPLESKILDRLVGYTREKFGSTSVNMRHSIRYISRYQKEGTPLVIGFISDQVPLLDDIHCWTPFLNHDTGIFTGAERIARKFGMDVYFAHMTRVSRGHYICEFRLMTDQAKEEPEHEISKQYMQQLDLNIREAPAFWLWTHRRWKRTHEEWNERQEYYRQIGRKNDLCS